MYEKETQELILQRMLERVSSRMDKREGSVIYDATAPASVELQNLYIAVDTILRETFADSATSIHYLNKRTSERGITRIKATAAVLKGEFTPTTLEIPIASRFSCEHLNYIVTEKIEDGVYRLICETAGTEGNRTLGTLIPIEYISGLRTAQLTELLIPGEDDESLESLRTRYLNSLNSIAFGGNQADYKEKISAIPGVGGVKVYPVWNGDISPTSFIPNAEVQEWFKSMNGTSATVSTWLNAVYTAALNKKLTVGGTVRAVILASDNSVPSGLFLDEIQTAIDPEQNAGEGLGLAPIGHVVTIAPVEAKKVNITTTITYSSGWSWDSAKEGILAAIDDYFEELCGKWQDSDYLTVRISQLESRILDCEGVLDISDTTLNGKVKNLELTADEIPVRGLVNGQ